MAYDTMTLAQLEEANVNLVKQVQAIKQEQRKINAQISDKVASAQAERTIKRLGMENVAAVIQTVEQLGGIASLEKIMMPGAKRG